MKKLFITSLLILTFAGLIIADGTDTSENVLYGTGAGASLETDATGFRASGNTMMGYNALPIDSTGSGNTGMGYSVFPNLTSGIGNIGMGYMAGESVTTGSHGLFIHNRWYPLYGIFGDLANGYIGINDTTPTRALDVTGSMAASDSVIAPYISATTSLIGVNATLTGRLTASSGDIDSLWNDAGGQIVINDSLKVVSVLTAGSTIVLENAETIDNAVNGTIRAYGKFIASGDSMGFTSEAVVTSVSEIDTSGVVMVGGKINMYSPTGGGVSIEGKAGSILEIAGNTQLPGWNIYSYQSVLGLGAVGGVLTTNDANEDLTIDPNGTGKVIIIGYTPRVQTITSDSTLTSEMSGDIITNTGAAAGDSLFLPTCASGLKFTFMSTDADSMILQCASGDSIFSGASLKPSFEGHAVNQSFTIVGLPTDGSQFNWIVESSTGTWAGN